MCFCEVKRKISLLSNKKKERARERETTIIIHLFAEKSEYEVGKISRQFQAATQRSEREKNGRKAREREREREKLKISL